ncbi:MAG: hypothetical protein WC344_03785 [Bacilli bacterium]|jgi:hypothetical protein
MANIKTVYFVCGVVHAQDRVLLVRPLAYNGRPYTPFFFPGTQVAKNDAREETKLIQIIKAKYKGELSVDGFMGSSVREFKDKRIVLRAYYCSLKTNFFLPRAKIDYRWATVEDFDSLRLESNDREIGERYVLFKRVYDGELVAGGRAQKEAAELNFYLDSFEYFGSKLDAKDARDFNELMRTSAPIEVLRRAYKYVMRINHLDYNAYLTHVEKKNLPKKKDLYKPTTDELDVPDRKTLAETPKSTKFLKGQALEVAAAENPPAKPVSKRKLTPAQIIGIVLLSIALLGEAAVLTIALVPIIPDFLSSVLGSIALIFSSLLLLVGVMLAFYGRKEE